MNNSSTFVMFVASIAAFLSTSDASMISMAVPHFMEEFHASKYLGTWIMSAYYLSLSTSLFAAGIFVDKFGIKTTLLSAFILILGASFLGYWTHNIYIIIAVRLLQGVGGGMLLIALFSIPKQFIVPEKRSDYFSHMTTVSALGMASGMFIGGFIISYFSAYAIFLLQAMLALLGIAVTWFLSRSNQAPPQPALLRIGTLELILFSLMIVALFLILNKTVASLQQILLVVITTTVSGFYLFYKRTLLHTIYALVSTTNIKAIATKFFISFLAFSTYAGFLFLLPLMLHQIYQFPAHQAGMMLLAFTIPLGVIGFLKSHLFKNRSQSLISMLAGVLVFSGILVMFTTYVSVAGLIIGLILYGLGFGLFNSTHNALVMLLAPEQQAGLFSSLYQLIVRFSMAVGILIFIPTHYADQESYEHSFIIGMLFMLLVALLYLGTYWKARAKPTS
jgi:DHA2 family metal-tetracycline-proton antiporter-like MFS transporter